MVPEQSKWLIALKSAARGIIVAAGILIGILELGIKIQSWHDLYDPRVLAIVAGALGLKGLSTGTTAKDVTVKV